MEKVLYSQVNDSNVGGVTEMAVSLLLLERVSGARFGATGVGLCLGKSIHHLAVQLAGRRGHAVCIQFHVAID